MRCPPDPPIQPQGIILTYAGLRAAGLRPAPYAGVALSADGARTWRVGSRLSVDPGLSVDLEGTRGEPPPTGRSTPSRCTGGTEPFVQCRDGRDFAHRHAGGVPPLLPASRRAVYRAGEERDLPRTAARRMKRADDDGNLIPLGYARSTRSIAERRITSEAPDTKASVGS